MKECFGLTHSLAVGAVGEMAKMMEMTEVAAILTVNSERITICEYSSLQ
jgi:hypothetical protein